MKKLILATCLATALSACGGNDNETDKPITVDPNPPVIEDPITPEEPTDETREEMIERVLSLPPEPDTELNNSTVEGIDENNNGIRDDIERVNAFTYYPDLKKIAVTNEMARLNREAILNIDNIDELQRLYLKSIVMVECEFKLFSREERAALKMRPEKRTELRDDFYKRYNSIEELNYLEHPSDEENLQLCNDFLSSIE